MNTIKASGAALSAGSIEALCVFKASSAGTAECLSVVRLSGAQHLGLVLALCAAQGMVASPWSGMLF